MSSQPTKRDPISSLPARYDVIVAGARCAGASTAMLLARGGFRVLVVDPLPRGRDTLSTHALMRGGVVQLHRWGILDAVRNAGTPVITSTTFDYRDESVTVPIKPSDGVDGLYAPRRTVLDPLLAEAAEEAGAHVIHGLSVVDVERDASGRVRGAVLTGPTRVRRTIAADLVIGADGVRSRVARLVDAPLLDVAHHTTANVFGYWEGLKQPDFVWSFRSGVDAGRPGRAVGTIPTNHGTTLVFASPTPSELARAHARAGSDGLEALLEREIRATSPALWAAMTEGRREGPLRAFAGLPGHLRRPWGPGWALVGDAGYFKDPLTAHGITDALRDAELLARAVERGDEAALADYEATRNEASRGLMEVTDRIASLTWTDDEVKGLHRRLSDEMKKDLDVIRSFRQPPRRLRRRSA